MTDGLEIERRKTQRTDLGNCIAHIALGDSRSLIEVCVWNVSTDGACLMVPQGVNVPETFDLIIDGVTTAVRRRWQKEIFAGVSFCEAQEPPNVA